MLWGLYGKKYETYIVRKEKYSNLPRRGSLLQAVYRNFCTLGTKDDTSSRVTLSFHL